MKINSRLKKHGDKSTLCMKKKSLKKKEDKSNISSKINIGLKKNIEKSNNGIKKKR